MRYIIKEMGYKMPCRLFWFSIFLATHMAVPAIDFGIAIQANIFLPFF
jgi:hypothetical protein